MRRVLAGIAAGMLLLTGCGGGDDAAEPAETTATSSSTSAAATTSEAGLGQVDIYACQSFVADLGEERALLVTLQRTGTLADPLSQPGYLELYNIGGRASLYVDQVESPELRDTLASIVEEGDAFQAAIDSGQSVSPGGLVALMGAAAAICEDGGFVIDWA